MAKRHDYKPVVHKDFTEVQQEIAIDMAYHGERTASICSRLGISQRTFSDYLYKYPLFAKEITKARLHKAHILVEELIDLTDGLSTMADAALARVKSENIKWIAEHYAPEYYGARIDINVNNNVDISKALEAADNRLKEILNINNALDVTPDEKK